MVQTNELTTMLGEENVLTGEGALREYAEDLSFAPRARPACILRPGSAAEVREIVRWANRNEAPLVPVSSGPPHFNGDTVPGAEGACVVDLGRMRRIIRIDRRNRSAMVEPGVTFGELIPALGEHGLSPLMPFVPRASKSVVAAFLERTPITIPRLHWEAQDPLQCVEVIYGDGELMRTGSAAGPGTLEEQWKVGRAQVRGMGPSQVDFTRLLQGAQGTMGIVTWSTIRLRPRPTVRRSFLLGGSGIDPLIELVYRITYKKLGEELLVLNRAQLARVMGEAGPEREKLPEWILYLGVDGDGLFPEEKVAYQEKEARRLAEELGLGLETGLAGLAAEDLGAVLSRPSHEPYWKLGPKGGNQDVFFLSTLDRSPAFIRRMKEMCGETGYDPDGVGVYLQPTVQGCNCHIEFSLAYDPADEGERGAVRRLVSEGAAALAEMGAFFSRPYGEWRRFAYDREGTHALGQRKLKDIFDPRGVMNPGRLCF